MIRCIVGGHRITRNDDVFIGARFVEIGAQAKRKLHHTDVGATARNHKAIEAL